MPSAKCTYFALRMKVKIVAKHNRILPHRLWVLFVGLLAAILVGVVITAVILDCLPKNPDAQTPPGGRATSADLYCLEFSSFSGAYVEDGSNTPVSGVAAALIENRSREFLDLATVTYDVGGRTAKFVVTGLPSGEKAWVMEANRLPVGGNSEFRFKECTSTFRQDATTETQVLQLTSAGNALTIRNNSDRVLENVCLYYKNLHSDGAYLGGITYIISFGTLEPGQSAEKIAAHFSEDSRVVRYSFQSG